MNKNLKIVIVFVFVAVVQTEVFSEVILQQSANNVIVDWSFSPEVSTYLGVNIDQEFFGMEGEAKLRAKTVIRKKETESLIATANENIYAQVEIKDLSIKFDTEDQSEGRENRVQNADGSYKDGGGTYSYGDSSNDVSGSPLQISWGDINGSVFFGPVYIELKFKEHEKLNFVDNLQDSDFIVVEYDIIPPAYTGRYANTPAQVNYLNDNGTIESTSKIEESVVQPVLTGANLGALGVGFKIPKLIDIKAGISTKWSYADRIVLDYNPLAFSVFLDLLLIPEVIFKFKFAMITGENNREIFEEDNPISLGAIGGYDINFGSYGVLRTIAGFDIKFEEKDRFVPYGADNLPRKVTEYDGVLTTPVEIAVGLNYYWNQQIALKKVDKDRFEGGDHEVSDGVGVAFLYGRQTHYAYRDISIDYIGTKIAFWESEDVESGKTGVVPGLEAMFVGNINYAIGGDFKTENILLDSVSLKPQLDMGFGLDMSYEISFVKLELGALYKFFNVLEETTAGRFKYKTGQELELIREDDADGRNPHDLRMKFGVNVIKLVPNTTFTVLWESGDLLHDDTGGYTKEQYSSDNAFFDNEGDDLERNVRSNAQFGYIKFGTKIAF